MSYTQLTSHERYIVYHLKLFKLSLREIARRLNRHHSTISREIKRNGPKYHTWVYVHELAHQWAMERRRKPRHYRRRVYVPLVRHVEERIRQSWSPEMISGRLKRDYPRHKTMRVSAETIYRWVYRDAIEGGTLHQCLCRRHKKRRKQRRYGTGRNRFPDLKRIHQRPGIVDTRRRFGDWEGDTVEGAKGSGHIATHVERKSRYLLAAKLDTKSAKSTTESVVAAYHTVPKSLRRTLTVDNGSEFARFSEIERQTGMTIYFADPYAAWQRGANENTNGLLRRFFPKGSDFRLVTPEVLAAAVKKLNNRPRKCLDYQTPIEVFQQAKRGALRK